MGSAQPKQFLLLGGRPLLMYSIEAFYRFDARIPITVVLPGDQSGCWEQLCRKYGFDVPHKLEAGGGTRFGSVQNGLRGLAGSGLVAIHDGVRPLIQPDTIARLFAEAAIHSSAIPVISSTDSLRWQDDQGNRPIDRSHVRIIQTPQIFDLDQLREAYLQPYQPSFTDDASVWEQAGNPVHLAEGHPSNLHPRPEGRD